MLSRAECLGPNRDRCTIQSVRRRWQKEFVAGEITYKPLRPLRGECRMFSGASAVNTRAHTSLPSAHGAAGALGTRHSLRPCFQRARDRSIARVRSAPRDINTCSQLRGQAPHSQPSSSGLTGRRRYWSHCDDLALLMPELRTSALHHRLEHPPHLGLGLFDPRRQRGEIRCVPGPRHHAQQVVARRFRLEAVADTEPHDLR
jgi:hypothetical protein